jgi:hypothetical protein
MKIGASFDQNGTGAERRDRLYSGDVENIELADPERA